MSLETVVMMRWIKGRGDSLLLSWMVLLSVLLSAVLLAPRGAKKNRLRSQFSSGRCGGDGGESNSPSKQTYHRMYYRLSRRFFFTLQPPIDRIPQRWPSGLKRRLEDSPRRSIPCVLRPSPVPQKKTGWTTRHWVLSSESVSSCLIFGSYCFVGCLTRVRTDTSTCNSTICSPVETRHPQMK